MIFLLKIFFKRIRIPEEKFRSIEKENPLTPKVFVVRRQSYITTLLFRFLVSKFSKPPIYISQKDDFKHLDYVLSENGSILLFCKHKGEQTFEKEITHIFKQKDVNINAVLLLWIRKVRKQKHSFQDHPRGILKLILLLLNNKNAEIILSNNINCDSVKDKKDLKRFFLDLIETERQIVIGPRQFSKNQVIENILRDERFINELTKHDAEKIIHKKVEKYLKEIATDKRLNYITRFIKFLEWVWNKTSEGIYIDKKGLETVRELSKHAQLIYVPCHRSHADYLLIGHYLQKYNLDTPITAAGVNLSFFPLGFIFRRMGAYFLRRSFKGNPIYSATFTRYLEELLVQGASQKFYIEGGRSRTGKILSPKFGMLSMVLKIFQKGKIDNLYFIPMSVDYGKLFEGESYINELRGKNKDTESISGIFESLKYLKRKQGVNYIQFGNPISAESFFNEKNVDIKSISDEEHFQEVTSQLGYRITHEINKAVTITPSSVVSTVLLSNQTRGITKEELNRFCKMIYTYLSNKNVRIPESFKDIEKNVQQVIGYFSASNYIKTVETTDITIYKVNESSRLFLDYYKNNIIHVFLPIAFISTILLKSKGKSVMFDELIVEIQKLKRLFRFEFIYSSDVWKEQSIKEILRYLSILKEIKVENDIIQVSEKKGTWLKMSYRIILNYYESYYAFSEFALNKSLQSEPKKLISSSLIYGDSLYDVGAINREEAVSRDTFKNALQYLYEVKILEKSDSGYTFTKNGKTELTQFRNELYDLIKL